MEKIRNIHKLQLMTFVNLNIKILILIIFIEGELSKYNLITNKIEN